MIIFKIKYSSLKDLNNYLRDRWICIGNLEQIFNKLRHGNLTLKIWASLCESRASWHENKNVDNRIIGKY